VLRLLSPMKRQQESTLFRPADAKTNYASGRRQSMRPGAPGQDNEEPTITLTDRFSEALRAAGRRKFLALVVLIVGIALTVVASLYAPKSYECASRILVSRTAASLNAGGGFPATADEKKDMAREFEEQIRARENLEAIVKQTQLVERWEEMRQPYQKILDDLRVKMGRPALTDEMKFDVLVKTLDAKLKVTVDATTVMLELDWPHPETAKEIVAAAIKNFTDTRYSIEIGMLPERLKIYEADAARAKAEVVSAVKDLSEREEKKSQVTPGGGATVRRTFVPAPPGTDPALARKLEQIRGEIEEIKAGRDKRLAELNYQLTEMQQTYAAGHPQVIALKATIESTKADPPKLVALKEQESKVLADIDAAKGAAPAPQVKHDVAPAPAASDAPVAPTGPKSLADVNAQFETANRKYEAAMTKMETLRIEIQTAEAEFKHRYKVTHPAEVPANPKRPSGLIAAVVGALCTILAALGACVLADRFSGIFYEPRDVRDRLELPVLATLKW